MTPTQRARLDATRKMLQAVADGFCYPVLDTSEARMLANLAAAGYVRRVARKVYAITETGREELATLTKAVKS